MITRIELSEKDIYATITAGELPERIRTSAPRFVLVATQDWCPKWRLMERWLTADQSDQSDQSGDSSGIPDVTLAVIIYNNTPYHREFMQHKESVWGNALVPYLRFYHDGVFSGDANRLSREAFYARVRSPAAAL